MNRIIVKKNGVIDGNNISVSDNIISFNTSGTYQIVYQSNKIFLEFNINDVEIELYESLFSTDVEVHNKYNIRNGKLSLNKFYSNKMVSEEIDVNLFGVGDRIDYYFSSICVGSEDYNININHKNKDTVSNISNKCVSLREGKINFVINSSVFKECDGSFMDQNTRIITLDNSLASVSPNMFVDIDSVVAKHGSVIGNIKPEQLFYMMAKGIRYEEARKLIVKGYLFSNGKLLTETRSKIMDKINEYWR